MYRQSQMSGFSLTSFWNTIKNSIHITPPKVSLPPIQIPGTVPPASNPPSGRTPVQNYGGPGSGGSDPMTGGGAVGETPSWLLPVGLAAAAGLALMLFAKRSRRS